MKYILPLVLFFFSIQAKAQSVVFAAPVAFSVTSTSTLALAPNGKRNYLIIINTGAVAAIVKFGSVQSANEGISIPPGGNYEPWQAAANVMYAKTASGSTTLTIVQGQNSP